MSSRDGLASIASGFFGCALLAIGLGCAGADQPPSAPATSTSAPVTTATEPSAAPSASVATPAIVDAGPTELRAWFSLLPVKCTPNTDPATCYRVTLSLRGAKSGDEVIDKSYWSQLGCSAGADVDCSGPSGRSSLTLRCDAAGTCRVEDFSVSDGYCPNHDCGSRTERYRFTVPAGTKVVYAKP